MPCIRMAIIAFGRTLSPYCIRIKPRHFQIKVIYLIIRKATRCRNIVVIIPALFKDRSIWSLDNRSSTICCICLVGRQNCYAFTKIAFLLLTTLAFATSGLSAWCIVPALNGSANSEDTGVKETTGSSAYLYSATVGGGYEVDRR